MNHVPVMAGEIMDLVEASAGRSLLDLTVGAGGHASAFLAASAPTGTVIGCDRDPHALALAAERLAEFGDRVRLERGTSVECLRRLAAEGVTVDAVLMDLGLSSMQLDDEERGFTLRTDTFLDMRMDPDQELTAERLVNTAGRDRLVSILRDLGDEPRAERIADAIVARRKDRRFRTTGDLRLLVESVLGRRGGKIHVATRTFQGLRMAVNRERELLVESLALIAEVLRPGGVLAVLAFESGDDRLIKTFMKEQAAAGAELLTRRALRPAREEVLSNRRSRSARLRALKVPGATS